MGLICLRINRSSRRVKKVIHSDLISMAEPVLKQNIFEFNCKNWQQIFGTAVGTKYAYAYFLMMGLKENI